MPHTETYISVDVETAGPTPGQYALLSIGACVAFEPAQTFYVELKPDKSGFTPEALAVSGLDLDDLARSGLPPEQALLQFEAWVASVTPPDRRPVFVAFNAPFDWMFAAEYFHSYLGRNPFGHSALDMKAYFMGQNGVAWAETGFDNVSCHFGLQHPLTHNALQDALDQAILFRKMLDK
jgi:DNA polymerase III epsilon subunit-like protein